VRTFIDVSGGLEDALAAARGHGAALIAAHPYELDELGSTSRTTARWSEEPDWAAEIVDRLELCNRHDFFAWVARERLPVVANGDFHRPEHLATWKTLVPTEKNEEAVVEYLRSCWPVSLALVEPPVEVIARAA
jgi:processive 1,2-diacylglycerol beta-glucosyltransferase